MKKELLLSVATGVLAIVPAAGVWAACTSSPDCFSLGYKYSASDCSNGGVKCPFDTSMYFCFSPESECTYSYTADYCSSQCKYTGTTSCQKNGKTYYASCGSSKCSYGQNCSNGTCITPAPSCTYQYTAQSCSSECRYTGYNSCVRSGITYYESCGTSYCNYGEECNNGICKTTTPNCNYTITAADCTRQCKNVGSVSCTKNGMTYYQSCGSSKCASGETCENGTCNFQCIYQNTASDCARQCKNPGNKSCVRNGTTYYESCGSSYCTAGQTCNGYGKCESGGSSGGGDVSNPTPKEGSCCGYINYCGYSGGTSNSYDNNCYSYDSKTCYNECKSRGYPDCNDMHASCRASGGTPVFQHCTYPGNGTYGVAYVDYSCQ